MCSVVSFTLVALEASDSLAYKGLKLLWCDLFNLLHASLPCFLLNQSPELLLLDKVLIEDSDG